MTCSNQAPLCYILNSFGGTGAIVLPRRGMYCNVMPCHDAWRRLAVKMEDDMDDLEDLAPDVCPGTMMWCSTRARAAKDTLELFANGCICQGIQDFDELPPW
eukprot:g64405.t1